MTLQMAGHVFFGRLYSIYEGLSGNDPRERLDKMIARLNPQDRAQVDAVVGGAYDGLAEELERSVDFNRSMPWARNWVPQQVRDCLPVTPRLGVTDLARAVDRCPALLQEVSTASFAKRQALAIAPAELIEQHSDATRLGKVSGLPLRAASVVFEDEAKMMVSQNQRHWAEAVVTSLRSGSIANTIGFMRATARSRRST